MVAVLFIAVVVKKSSSSFGGGGGEIDGGDGGKQSLRRGKLFSVLNEVETHLIIFCNIKYMFFAIFSNFSLPFQRNGHENGAEGLPVAGRHQTVENEVHRAVHQREQVQQVAQGQIDEPMDVPGVDGVQHGQHALGELHQKENDQNCEKHWRGPVRGGSVAKHAVKLQFLSKIALKFVELVKNVMLTLFACYRN
jgi:hypothetical protein